MKTNPTPYNQLRQLLTERHEHLRELSFGCEIKGNNGKIATIIEKNKPREDVYRIITGDGLCSTEKGFEVLNIILGHPPTLQDILLAVNKIAQVSEKAMLFDLSSSRILISTGIGNWTRQSIHYDLTKPLADQDGETLLALIELIK